MKRIKEKLSKFSAYQKILFILLIVFMVLTDIIFIFKGLMYAIISLLFTLIIGFLFYKCFK